MTLYIIFRKKQPCGCGEVITTETDPYAAQQICNFYKESDPDGEYYYEDYD